MGTNSSNVFHSPTVPHLILGIDSVINNRGSQFSVNTRQKGLEKEQCATLMESLGWTYEFVDYHNNIGYVDENGTAVGLLGDIYHGRIDMACGRFRMTTERLKFLTFAYPINFSVRQVYLIRDPGKKQDMSFMLMPFSTHLWILLGITIVTITLALLLIRYVEFVDNGESLKKTTSSAVYHMISFSTNFTIEAKPLPSYVTFWAVVTLWMVVWSHVIIAYYTSELRGMLIVSSKKKVPFSDFDGFVKNLREGTYRFLAPSHEWRPQCPGDRTENACVELFDRIFARNPPVIAAISQLSNDSFIRKQPIPLVSVQWYDDSRIGGKYAVWTHLTFKSDVWVIKDFYVSPAAFIVASNFSYLHELNSGIIRILPAFKKIETHYTPTYPKAILTETPKTSAFTFTQLSSIFYVHGTIMFLSFLILIGEIIYDRIHRGKMERVEVTTIALSTFVTGFRHKLKTR
ncbi:hypothetical protein Y032_0076g1035 [Ancylostoma ceylanicum]|nr:hypothetical protein Y032_0076g1035 [Ancylostoma ceylanicum]